MFHDARQIPDTTILEADLCIVGAGAAGITIARELDGSSLRVILLEGGGLEMDTESQTLYKGENIGLPYPDPHTIRSRYLGGSSNCWGGWCRPFDAIDFEKRDWVPHSGWPFGRDTMEPFYERAHVLCQLGKNNYDPGQWKETADDLDLDFLPPTGDRVVSNISQLSQQPRFGVAYGDQIKRSANVQAYLNANVLEFETNDTASTVSGVRVATLAGNEFQVRAKRYVLATGGFENPRMLLMSNRVQTAGLGNQYDLVGRYFMEHPRVQMGTLTVNDRAQSLDIYDVQYAYFNSPIAASLGVTPETQRHERMLNYKAWILAVYYGEDSKGGEALKNIYRAIRKTTLPDHLMDTSGTFWLKNIGTVVADLGNSTAVAAGRLLKIPQLIKMRRFAHLVEPMPNPDSRITLGPEKDRFGLNRIRVNWQLTALDKYSIRRGQEIVAEDLHRLGIGQVSGELLDCSDDEWPRPLLYGWHQMGTTRMHEDPKQGVVDADCRVHGIENLFIAGSSVFTTGGSDLPTLTIVALALRLADHLKEKFEI